MDAELLLRTYPAEQLNAATLGKVVCDALDMPLMTRSGALQSRPAKTALQNEWVQTAGQGGCAHVDAVDIDCAFERVSHCGVLHKA